ncbi:MAG: G5 domain-containing protein [Clostridiales bacterium]|jgi:3D (Asp-Asp-Asp) domain-containing protein/uncharacterized protein YabE (DUF348 family)|nr:G5 domain-containing protein [Clostridiales bacterium]
MASNPSQKTVIYLENGHSAVYNTSVNTVHDFLIEQGISLTPYDTMNLDDMNTLDDGSTVEIKRGFYVNLSIDGQAEERLKVSQGATVGELVSQLSHERGQEFTCSSSLLPVLHENDWVYLTARRAKTLVETESIPYETQIIKTVELTEGVEKVTQEGAAGAKELTLKVIYDGETEITREIVSENVAAEPVTRVVRIGIAKPNQASAPLVIEKPAQADIASASFTYISVLTMNASAYTAGPESTGKRPGDPGYGITASGKHVEPGVVAVDPSIIPLGTRLYVEGYGYAVAADTGGAIKGNKIDLYMETLAEAYQFGRRMVTVYVLD